MGDFYGWVFGDLPPGLAALGWLNFLAFSVVAWLFFRFLRKMDTVGDALSSRLNSLGEKVVAQSNDTRKKVEDEADKTRTAIYARDMSLTALLGTVSSAVSDVRGWLGGFSAGRVK